MTAVDSQVTSSHEAARTTDQKDSDTSILVWPTQATQHVLSRPIQSAIRSDSERICDHGSQDVAWRDGVHTYPILTPLRCQISRKLNDGALGSIVSCASHALKNKLVSSIRVSGCCSRR